MVFEDLQKSEADKVSNKVIGAAIEVHRNLGPGLLESAYEECFCQELRLRGIGFERQKYLPVYYKGQAVDCDYRLDLLVEDKVIVEIKAISAFSPLHEAQLMTYLKLSNLWLGLLINFNVMVLRDGIKRVVLVDFFSLRKCPDFVFLVNFVVREPLADNRLKAYISTEKNYYHKGTKDTKKIKNKSLNKYLAATIETTKPRF